MQLQIVRKTQFNPTYQGVLVEADHINQDDRVAQHEVQASVGRVAVEEINGEAAYVASNIGDNISNQIRNFVVSIYVPVIIALRISFFYYYFLMH